MFCFFADESCVAKQCCGQPFSHLFSTVSLFISTLPWPHLTVRPEASLLKPGPDTLDSAGVLWMTGGVATDTLVLLHQRVIHQTYKRTQIHQKYYDSPTTLGVVSSFTFLHNKQEVMWGGSGEMCWFHPVNCTCGGGHAAKRPGITCLVLILSHCMKAQNVVCGFLQPAISRMKVCF